MDSLDKAYACLLRKLDRRNPQAKDILFRTLLSLRPLKVREISHIFGLQLTRACIAKISPANLDSLLAATRTLVNIDPKWNVFKFYHRTLEQYLNEAWRSNAPAVQEKIAIVLLRCLLSDSHAVMQDYASIHWDVHYRETSESEYMISLAKQFLLGENIYLSRHKRIPWNTRSRGRIPRNVTGAHVAGHFGLQSLMVQLAAVGEGPDTRDENGETPMLWAARNGQPDTVVWLVEQGADTSVVNFEWRRALHYAASHKWTAALRSLLKKGVAISQGIENLTPIHYAVLSSWEHGVEAS